MDRTLVLSRWVWLPALGIAVLVAAAALGWNVLRGTPVAVAVVRNGEVVVQVGGPGTVQARVPLTVSARLTSTVAEVAVDVGDSVQPGQLLALLEARDLVARHAAVARQQKSLASQVEAAAATVAKAHADLELARIRERRDADLHAQGFVSPAALDASVAASRGAEAVLRGSEASWAARRSDQQALAEELVIARAQVGYTRLVAPMPGRVIQRLVEPGTTVAPGTPILRLVDPATLWIAMRVDEALVDQVAVGQPATIRLRSGSIVPGRVERVTLQSDAATRELEVNVAFSEMPRRIAIDQDAQVHIDVGREHGLLVPAAAVAHDAAGRAGVLQVSGGRTHLVPVRVGPAGGGMVVVSGRLEEGAIVVADAGRAGPGMRVRPAGSDPTRAGIPWNSP
ncbi:efflux RND transporter periplasmic adaptor subunit [Ramlibacter sp. Leaf400]|uniref:efflux RND transporter periplasmic adaptor subunit n=1 Tax=Ramlibacter sp. Leaf400 TaxID=1736365 RepID=UPI000701E95E|nr:efflux RND transporter periplasmic adaptor subunit [Ramlibacter sp. Leaf400]KQT10866.1 hypothetical protein ASG30_08650 [Ramlibacter sp. Leaf400]